MQRDGAGGGKVLGAATKTGSSLRGRIVVSAERSRAQAPAHALSPGAAVHWCKWFFPCTVPRHLILEGIRMNRGTVRFRSDVQNLFHSPGDGAISGERGCMQGCPPPPPSPAAASVRWGRHTSRVLCTTSSGGLCHPCMEISFSWRVVFGWEQPPPPHLGAPSPLCTSCSPAGHRCALSERIQPKDIQKTSRRQREDSEKAGWACGFPIVQEHKQRLISLLLLLILQLPFVWALSDGFRGRPPPPCCMEDH